MKVIVVLLVFMSWVGYSHTDAEKRRYVDAILTRTANVASDDNWASEGRDPDPNNVLESWEGFLGRPGGNTWVGGWSIAERRAAFDWYLETLTTTNSLSFSDNDKVKVFMAFGTCKRFAYTNSVHLLRRAALVVASPTNAPAAFSTEAERTFLMPDITERNVWLDCGRMVVRDGNGNELHSEDAFDYPLQLSFVPAHRGTGAEQ